MGIAPTGRGGTKLLPFPRVVFAIAVTGVGFFSDEGWTDAIGGPGTGVAVALGLIVVERAWA